MNIFTLDSGFVKQNQIDTFESAIWTERYYGDGDFEISVPSNDSMNALLRQDTLMMIGDSDEPMILDTRDIKDGILKVTGIALPKWLNNRIIRTSNLHAIKEWLLTGLKPAAAMASIVQEMCVAGDYLDGTIDIGIDPFQTLAFRVPGLTSTSLDPSGSVVDFSVPFGPVYDALHDIGTTYEVGMKIILDHAVPGDFQINFYSYKGADLTSGDPVIRFSPEMESFTNVSDLSSNAEYRNSIYMFAPTANPLIATYPGMAGPRGVGFGLKVFQGFVDDLPDGVDVVSLLNLLNQKAGVELKNHKFVSLVDGEIIQKEDLTYGTDFFMGDIIEVEGNTGVIQQARITEYIRSQDKAGERAYPTLTIIDD